MQLKFILGILLQPREPLADIYVPETLKPALSMVKHIIDISVGNSTDMTKQNKIIFHFILHQRFNIKIK